MKEEASNPTDPEKCSLMDDVEAQATPGLATDPPPSPTCALEYSIPARRKLVYLAGYFTLNLTLTIYNKAVLGKVSLVPLSCLRAIS